MKTEDLKKRIIDFLGIETADSELAYKLFVQRITEELGSNDAIKIDGLGVFQLKKDPLPRAERSVDSSGSAKIKESLIYSPPLDDLTIRSKSLFVTIPINKSEKDNTQFDESIFSLSIHQPLIPLGSSNIGSDFVDRKKIIQEKINSKVADGYRLKDFDIWTDYLNENPVNRKPEKIEKVGGIDEELPKEEPKGETNETLEEKEPVNQSDKNEGVVSIEDIKGIDPETEEESDPKDIPWDWSEEFDEALAKEEFEEEETEIDEDDPFASLEASLKEDLEIEEELKSKSEKVVPKEKPRRDFSQTLFDDRETRKFNTDLYEEETEKEKEQHSTENPREEKKV